MATAVLSCGNDLCVVLCGEVPVAFQRTKLSQDQQLGMLLDMVRRQDHRDIVMRLLEHHCHQVFWRTLPPQQLRANLLRLLMLTRLEVRSLPRLTTHVMCSASAVLRGQGPARPNHEDQTSAGVLPLHTTALQLWYTERERPLRAPVQFEADAAVHVAPSKTGHAIEVPRALDTSSTVWQLQHLVQAARQGSLDTWGAGMGDTQAAATSSALDG